MARSATTARAAFLIRSGSRCRRSARITCRVRKAMPRSVCCTSADAIRPWTRPSASRGQGRRGAHVDQLRGLPHGASAADAGRGAAALFRRCRQHRRHSGISALPLALRGGRSLHRRSPDPSDGRKDRPVVARSADVSLRPHPVRAQAPVGAGRSFRLGEPASGLGTRAESIRSIRSSSACCACRRRDHRQQRHAGDMEP